MIHATQMAKAFEKPVSWFLRLQSTKDYLSILQSRYVDLHIGQNVEIIRVIKGWAPDLQWTRMHEKLALKFAARLSPEFELRVYDKIHELLTTGETKLHITPWENIIHSIRLITDQLETSHQDIWLLKTDVQFMKNSLDNLKAKIISIDENYYSISGYCALHHIDCPLDKAQSWWTEATKLSKQKNRLIWKAYDAKYWEINTYHEDILKIVFRKNDS